MMNKTWRHTLYEVLMTPEDEHVYEEPVRRLLGLLIVINIVCGLLETMPSMKAWYTTLERIELASVVIFAVEYLIRLWICVEEEGRSSVIGRVRYAMTPMMLIDLGVIIVTFVPVFLDIRSLRALRLVRLLKLGRHSRAVRLILRVLATKKEELTSCLWMAMIILIMASSMMFYAEHDIQPESFPSIPATMWWGVTTMTTVGYGDVIPMTAAGKIVGAMVSIGTLGLFGLPAAILAAGFVEELSQHQES